MRRVILPEIIPTRETSADSGAGLSGPGWITLGAGLALGHAAPPAATIYCVGAAGGATDAPCANPPALPSIQAGLAAAGGDMAEVSTPCAVK